MMSSYDMIIVHTLYVETVDIHLVSKQFDCGIVACISQDDDKLINLPIISTDNSTHELVVDLKQICGKVVELQ